MATIKVYPPSQLPDRGVSETQFKIWIEELEVYLSQVDRYEVFLEEGAYSTWDSQENKPDRITAVKGEDLTQPDRTKDAANIKRRCRDLRTVLSIVGKCVSQGHYEAVIRHSTSMQWIFDMLRCDYDIQQKGIHFLNILDLKYDSSKMTPIAFYNQYRTMITNNLSRKEEVIKFKNNLRLTEDERMTPMLEDMVLLNVLKDIDPRLPSHIRTHYTLKMSKTDKLMDFKNDIMTNIPKFLQELDKEEHLGLITGGPDSQLKWMRQQNQKRQMPWQDRKPQAGGQTGGQKPAAFGYQNQKMYCRLCHKSNLPRAVYTSHNLGDKKCAQLSSQDRQKLEQTFRMASINTPQDDLIPGEQPDKEGNNLAKEFGYGDCGELDDSSIQM
eukprot:GFUD01110119.1.p1 GENE.GFUD01110119.1~~GFUD01110119.1.p1  ORF type:complete len:383 (+),score=89.10 GFUD01110119.1:253-1401(+)